MNEGQISWKNNKIIIGCIISSIVLVILLILLFVNVDKKKDVSYKVVFNSDGGTRISEQVVKSGNYAKKPSDPEKEGYEFIEWLYNDKSYDFKTKVTKNMVLVAKWYKVDESIETFAVKFNSDGGTTISNQIVEKGKQLSKPIDPTRDGYTFKGWILNGEVYDFTSSVDGDFELVASWEKNKEVTTKDNKVTNKTTNKQTSTTQNRTQPPTTTTTKKTTTTTTTTKQKQNYTVTFNSNGGSSVSAQTVTEGNRATRPSDPTREGYRFNGWTLNGSSYNFTSAVNSNITLVASWIQKNYVVKVYAVDQYSPDRILKVFEDGTQISVSAIKHNGVILCSVNNMVVNMYEISGISSVTVVLRNGSSVTASMQQ